MNGYGEFLWSNGSKYTGYYKNDIKNGYGILYFSGHSEDCPKFWEGYWQ